MRRRDFFRLAGAGGAGAMASLGLLPGWQRYANAAPLWGDYPDYAAASLLPPEKQAKNVLEVFMYGGFSPWETFYVVPEFGKTKGEQWWTFQEGANNVAEIYTKCHGAEAGPMVTPFATDDNGVQVSLGPFTEPLRSRKDIVERLRIHVITHSLEPHEAAIPYAMSGYRLGQPKLAGVGAAVQHYYQVRSEVTTGEPFAYVLFSPGDFPTDNLRAASSVGQHPGSSRPLAIRVAANTAFIEALKRKTVGDLKPQFDALLSHYTDAYRKRLMWPDAVEAARSVTLSDYQFSLDTLQQTDALIDILEPKYFEAIGGTHCGQSKSPNYPKMGFELARHVLTRPGSLARYAMVVDGGLIPASGGGGYDTHNKHVRDSARNLKNLWTNLSAIINEPDEKDPNKLNLDETLVVVNTEFGRTPWAQNGDGRNHHPYAYTTLMFGGPVGPDQQGIVGAIDETGYATNALHPAETRGAILSALGVYPFAPECYAVSDILAGASNETEAGLWLNEMVLGVTS